MDEYRCCDAVQTVLDAAGFIGTTAVRTAIQHEDSMPIVQAILALSEVVRALVIVQHMALEQTQGAQQ